MKPPIRTLWWKGRTLFIIDQSALPVRERILALRTPAAVWRAIRELKVRGAPAIGVAAAYGLTLSALASRATTAAGFARDMRRAVEYFRTCRPTAYNLFFTLERMAGLIEVNLERTVPALRRLVEREADRIFRDDLRRGFLLGGHGARLIRNGANILTHCNAGGLATAGFGTALAPLFAARRQGKRFHVFVDETRPVLQGARLTAYELDKTGIPHTLICDNMAGRLMRDGRINLVIVGADRITSRGDTANKTGTYSVAVLARYHRIPFYVAAPVSTFDMSIAQGREIPIEHRRPEEVTHIRQTRVAPRRTCAYNPAFDVTPAELITGFVTEVGILTPPYTRTLKKLFSGQA